MTKTVMFRLLRSLSINSTHTSTSNFSLTNFFMYLKLQLYVTYLALLHEDIWRSGYIDPRFLDHDTSWR
jgi:hypothetical protein